MTASELLRQAKALIADERNWWDGKGRPQFRLCAARAAWNVRGMKIGTLRFLQQACDGRVSLFNDHHTHPEVMAAFDRAIELAERQEAA